MSLRHIVSTIRPSLRGPSPLSLRRWQSTSTTTAKQQQSTVDVPEPSKGIPVGVKAYYIGRQIDLHKIQSDAYISSGRKELQSKSVTLTLNAEGNQYISVFKFGSVVMFNIPEDQHLEHIKAIRKAASVVSTDELEHTETYKVIIHDNLDKPSVIKAEHVNVRALDMNNVVIIGTVMAQSVALDFYAVSVDRMLEHFVLMNQKIQTTGSVEELSAKNLHKMVASNNVVMTNVLSKLGIFEGSDAAWENADYYYTWEALRKDFEIDYRFKDLSMKLDIIKDDSRFFLEVLHNQKSTKLEWIIIALIAGEMVVGLCNLAMH
eukprot:gene1225-1332_t